MVLVYLTLITSGMQIPIEILTIAKKSTQENRKKIIG